MKVIDENWKRSVLLESSTIKEAIESLNASSSQIVLVVSKEGIFQGTVTDGDIRRGLLRGLDLSSNIVDIIHRQALVAPVTIQRDAVIELMLANNIKQIPLIDDKQKLVGLHIWDKIAVPSIRNNTIVIMAGGMGKRLLPHTENCPKPMLYVSGKPILEHIICRAKLEGFKNFVISIHYLGDIIIDYFKDGREFGVNIQYLQEQIPLGTAGALQLLDHGSEQAIVVTNGDVLTDVRYAELIDFHDRHNASATVAIRSHEWQNPFGVVKIEGLDIVGFEEKPVYRTHINAGIYILDSEALELIQFNEYCDMPNLLERLRNKGGRVIAYPMHEPWLDVGSPDDLKLANLHHIEKVKN